ncbi:hypothetical protein [Paenibacillus eucommiae]|uniref:Uncharacterized protein n=1 Tax=Paenibacillus eucommiae TaxID=1355755 RepID=A0ABS4ILN1_9BACL|nr:hypothetical protein [Paenibacillus eucommiae]MBP1988430.1 hypothetical protein [Paenibacillus eucommiae]
MKTVIFYPGKKINHNHYILIDTYYYVRKRLAASFDVRVREFGALRREWLWAPAAVKDLFPEWNG